MAFGFGGSKSSSKTFIDPAQQPFLDFVRNSALGLYGGGAGQAGFQDLSGQLLGAGQDFLGTLGSNPFLSSLQAQAGGNPQLVQQQIGQLGQDIGQFTQEQLLPGINREAVGVGALGGARNQITQGLALQGAQRAFSSGATDIYTQDAQRGLQAATAGGGLAAQGALGGLSSLPGLLGLSPFMSQFAPLAQLAGIIGGPTVLSKGSSTGFNVGGGPG